MTEEQLFNIRYALRCRHVLVDAADMPTIVEAVAAAISTQARASEAEDAWISVEDQRKPELGQVILMWVYAEDDCEDEDGNYYPQDVSQVQMGVYRDMGHGPFFDCFATPFADHEGVGYWMPLPKNPGDAGSRGETK